MQARSITPQKSVDTGVGVAAPVQSHPVVTPSVHSTKPVPPSEHTQARGTDALQVAADTGPFVDGAASSPHAGRKARLETKCNKNERLIGPQ